jgi:hypothetical protein
MGTPTRGSLKTTCVTAKASTFGAMAIGTKGNTRRTYAMAKGLTTEGMAGFTLEDTFQTGLRASDMAKDILSLQTEEYTKVWLGLCFY